MSQIYVICYLYLPFQARFVECMKGLFLKARKPKEYALKQRMKYYISLKLMILLPVSQIENYSTDVIRPINQSESILNNQ